ncbi:MAG: S8 family serine peptidase [Firmicutes bacterium]|nr:S8 family serine peptidase [Bacillota bacterium]
MRKSTKSKLMALLLASIMVLSLLWPISLAAEENTSYTSYTQQEEDTEEYLSVVDEELVNEYGLHNLVPSQFIIQQQTGLIGFYGDYALEDSAELTSVIVIFRNNPAAVQVREAQARGMRLSYDMAEVIAESDHSLFRRELNELLSSSVSAFSAEGQNMSFEITHEYRNYLNGVSLTLPSNMVAYLAKFESVVAVYPNFQIEIGPFDFELLQSAIEYADDLIRNPQGMAAGRAKMGADEMHQLGFRGQGVVVAVIDSGIDLDHPAFEGAFLTYEEMRSRMDSLHGAGSHGFTRADTMYRHGGYFFFGRNFRLEDRPTRNNPNELLLEVPPAQRSSHGTHVAGTIAARDTGGEISALGVAPEAHIIAYRVFNRTGGAAADMMASFEMIMYDRPDVVNMSFGAAGDNNPMSVLAIPVTNIALLHPEIVLVNSMGNSGSNNQNDNNNFFSGTAPAQSTPVISVSAFEQELDRSFTLRSGNLSMNTELYLDSALSVWSSLANGRYVTTFNTSHVNGEYRILAMPCTTDATFYLPPPSAPGIPHPRQSLGSGTRADFEALAEKYGDELERAFVLVRRGAGWGDLQDRAIEFGVAGLINVNDFRPLPTRIQSMGRNELWHVPGMFVSHGEGIALYDSLVDGRGTFYLTNFTASPPTIAFFSSNGPVNMTFEINSNIGAHGHWVISTVPPAAIADLDDHDYTRAYAGNLGTSMSAPHVAGAAALMIQYSRETAGEQWTSYEIKTRMMSTAIPVGQGEKSVFQIGAGYVDVFAASQTDHFVMVAYDKVPWRPLPSGTTFWDQDFATVMTGSFSFNSRRMYLEDEDFVTRRLTAVIVNESSESRTYTISHRWTCYSHPSGLVQNPQGNATLHTSANTVTVPANSTGTFDVWMQISTDADFWFYEGFVDVYHGSNRVSALPFAFVAEATAVSDFRLTRPVISTGPYALHGASSVLEAVFTPNMGFGFDVWIFRDNEITADMDEHNWRTEERFREALVGYARQALINENATVPGRQERMSVFDGRYVPSFDDEGNLRFWPGPMGLTYWEGGGSGLPGLDTPRRILEEGDYIIMLDVYRQIGSVQILLWVIPIFSNWEDIDIMARFSVDNTPPQLDVNHEVQGSSVRIYGNANDLWLSQAIDRGVTFDVWHEGSPYGPSLSTQNNLAVFVNTPDGTVRVPIDAQGNFDHVLTDVMGHEIFEILVWAVDNYSITPRITHTLLWPHQIWSSGAEFEYPGGPLQRADRGLNQFVRTAHLAGYIVNDIFNDYVWVGSNFAEVRIPFGSSLLNFDLQDSDEDPVTPSLIPSVDVAPGRFIIGYLPETVPTRQFGVFTGWGIREGEDIVPITVEMRMPAYSITVYAMWHPYVEVSFNLNDTAGQPANPRTIDPIRVSAGTPIMAHTDFPADPTREGFEFAGWTLNGAAVGTNTLAPYVSITLAANWTPFVQLSFDLRGTEEYPTNPPTISPITILTGSVVRNHPDFPEDPTRAGDFVFAGWHINFTLIWNQVIDEVFSTLGLPAFLRPLVPSPQPGDDLLELLETFINIAENFLPPGTIPPGIMLLLPTFLPDWLPTVVPDNGMILVPQDFEMPPANLTLTAYWWMTRALSFETNGGTELATIMVIEDRKIMDSLLIAPTREGYVFGGWFMDAGLTQRLTSETMMPRAATTLFASWVAPQDGVAFVSTEAELRATLPAASGIHTVYLLQSITVTGATQLIIPNNRTMTFSSHEGVGRAVLTSAITSNNPMITIGVAPNAANRPNITMRNIGMTRAEGMNRMQNSRAITNHAVLTLENVEIYGFAPLFAFIFPNAAVGGAILNNHAQAYLTIRDSRFFNNEQGSGTISQAAGATMHIYDTEIFGNRSLANAGAVNNTGNNGRVFLTRVHIHNNIAFNDAGGVLLAGPGSRLEMWDVLIHDNVATVGAGGGVLAMQSNVHAVLHSGEIFNNSAIGEGIDMDDILDVPVTNFLTATGGGGLALAGSDATFTINGGVIHNNAASIGGGVSGFGTRGRIIMNGGEIRDNVASIGGGVGTFGNNSGFIMNGGEIHSNEAIYGGGVMVMYWRSGPPFNNIFHSVFDFYGGRIFNNTARNNSGGIHANGTVNFRNADPNSVVGNSPNNITTIYDHANVTGTSALLFDLVGGTPTRYTVPVWVPVDGRIMYHIPLVNPVREGFEFEGWFLDPLRQVPLTEENLMGIELTVLYAGWHGDVLAYSLSFELGGTEEAPTVPANIAPITVTAGSVIVNAPGFPQDPAREGYNFAGWYMDAEFETPLTPETIMPNQNTTVYAAWSPVVSGNAALAELEVTGYALTPEFDPQVLSYEVTVPYSTTYVEIRYAAYCQNAVVTISGPYDNLQVGENVITVTVTAEDGTTREYTINILRDTAPGQCPVPSFDIFNNGEGGSPSRPNADLAELGIIRMWTQLDGVNTPVYFAATDTIKAYDQDGSCAMEFVNASRMWRDGTGRLNYFNRIDVSKDGGAWQYINFTITVHGQTVELLLVNALFEEPVLPVLTFDIFNNGEGGSPSRPNPGLAEAGTIRMWTQLDGVNAPVYYAAADTIKAYDQDGNCAMYFVRVGRVWQAGTGWLDYFNLVDVNKNGAWRYINFVITAYGQTVEVLLVNANYPIQPLSFYLATNSVAVSNTNRHVSVFVSGTATGPITLNLLDSAPELVLQVRDNLWTPTGPAEGLVIGVAGNATITESRTVTLEVTRDGITVLLSIELVA